MRAAPHPNQLRNTFSTVRTLVLSALTVGLLTVSGGCWSEHKPRPRARFFDEIGWSGKGVWLKADTHLHTRYSDGAFPCSEIARKAIEHGCDVVAFTDHANSSLLAATAQYAEAIEAARRDYPDTVILSGLEWNVPPYGGKEHVTVLVPPGPDEWRTLTYFKARFDDFGREETSPALADEGLRWLAQQGAEDARPVAFLNHPSRKREHTESIKSDLRQWRAASDVMVGMSGAPGHQGAVKALGAYKGRLGLVDRWDPATANVGDAWDQLLQEGGDVWAARAPSDFHNATSQNAGDYWPGQFSETWLYAPERSANGALKALRAGSFFASHGHIVRQVELQVTAYGLSRPATAGETIAVPVDTAVDVNLRFVTPLADWQGESNRIDEVELVVIDSNGARAIRQSPAAEGPALSKRLGVPSGGFVLRCRGRSKRTGGDYLFYSNPVRVVPAEGSVPLAETSTLTPRLPSAAMTLAPVAIVLATAAMLAPLRGGWRGRWIAALLNLGRLPLFAHLTLIFCRQDPLRMAVEPSGSKCRQINR